MAPTDQLAQHLHQLLFLPSPPLSLTMHAPVGLHVNGAPSLDVLPALAMRQSQLEFVTPRDSSMPCHHELERADLCLSL